MSSAYNATILTARPPTDFELAQTTDTSWQTTISGKYQYHHPTAIKQIPTVSKAFTKK